MDKSNRIYVLGGLTFVGILISLWGIFFYVPTEKTLGIVQRIFYFHVSIGINTFIAFGIVCVASILYLWKRDFRYDIIAHSAAEIGVLFCTLVLITGSIWGKASWGAWWTWDARLTTSLVLWLIYIAYLMLRSAAGNNIQRARFASVFGIIGFVDVPIVYFSIHWWSRSMHPVVIKASGIGLAPPMLQTMLVSLGSIFLLHMYLLNLRIKLGKARHELDGIKIKSL